jgi:hypothetical protein
MRSLAPVLLSVGGAIVAVTGAIGGAKGAFNGKTLMTPYLVAYAVAAFSFVAAGIISLVEEETPNVAPVRYDDAPRGSDKNLLGRIGLVVTSDGVPAYEVHLISGKVGDSIPQHERQIQRLSASDGEGFIPINMRRADGSGLLDGLFDEMVRNKVEALPVALRYKSGKGHSYKTTFSLVRDVLSPRGLSIKDVRHGREWL